MPHPSTGIRSLLILIALSPLLLGALTGCEDPEARLDRIQAAAQTQGRVQTANELVAAFDAKRITFEAAMVRAESLLEAGAPESTLFTGAVLDFAARIEDQFPTGGEHELFWRRIGQLAYQAAFAAMAEQRWAEASTLVLAGPTRWQRESYWLAYPNHDILVAASLGHQGQTEQGIARLQSRPIVTPEINEAIAQLRELSRQQLRDRLRAQVQAEQAGATASVQPSGGS